MTSWIARLFGRSPSSAQIAKNRLKLVLSYDRTNLTPELLRILQDELVNVISAHLDIDRTGLTISTQRGHNGDHIIADIPVRGVRAMRRPPEVPPAVARIKRTQTRRRRAQ